MMPARTTKIRHDDETRKKIKAAQILNRLHAGFFGKLDLTREQVSIAKILLAKVLPDLSAIDHSGEIEHSYALVLEQCATSEEWEQQSSVN